MKECCDKYKNRKFYNPLNPELRTVDYCYCPECGERLTPLIHCEGCGRSLTDENGSSIIGVSITVTVKDDEAQINTDFIKRQMGKYEINKSYNFCYECWLDSLMGINREKPCKQQEETSLK